LLYGPPGLGKTSLAYLIGGFGLALIAFGQAFKKFKSGH